MRVVLRDKSDFRRYEQCLQTIAMSRERMSEDKRDNLRQEQCLGTRTTPRYRAIIGDKSTP